MDESFVTVDGDDGDVVLIFCEQFVVRFDVDFFEGELIVAACVLDGGFGIVAEVAAGARIDDYMWLHNKSVLVRDNLWLIFLPANR